MLRHTLTKLAQRMFWVYYTDNFIIDNMKDFKPVVPEIGTTCLPITTQNCDRVMDFREANRAPEYRDKICRGEIGLFAMCDGRMVGSIWATVNNTSSPITARTYMRLAPGEALVHDIVTSSQCRGRGIGPFMVGNIAAVLLERHRSNRIIIDVSFKNKASLRMMEKAGLRAKERVLYISAFGRQVLEKTTRSYCSM